jgi:hypothetical protein
MHVALVIAWFSSACVDVFVCVVIFAFSIAADINRESDVVWVCGSVVLLACVGKGSTLPLFGRGCPHLVFLCRFRARTMRARQASFSCFLFL